MRPASLRFAIFSLCFCSTASYASFGIDPGYSSTSGDGLAKNKIYDEAISGKVTVDPHEEGAQLKPWVSAPINNRTYFRIGIMQATTQLSGIQKAGNTIGTVSLASVESKKNNTVLAYGYKTDSWRSEFEYTYIPKFHYTNVPALSGMSQPVGIDATITGHVLMFNMMWDFDYIQRVIPYIGAGIGASYGRDKTSLNSLAGAQVGLDIHSNIGPSGQWLAGIRLRPIDPIIIDINYHNMYLWKGPRMRFESTGSTPEVKLHPTSWTSVGPGISITYQF